MRSSSLTVALLCALVGCSGEPSKFAVQNATPEVISNLRILKDGNPHSLGSLAPGQRREMQFNSYFESKYSLSYEKGGHVSTMNLCYQGNDFPADGLIIIGEAEASIKCR